MKTLILMTLTMLLVQCDDLRGLPPTPPATPVRDHKIHELSSDLPCKSFLWKHTYGAMERFGDVINREKPYDREVLRHRCVVVRGKVVQTPSIERDGDVKLKLEIDPLTFIAGYYKEKELLNPVNKGLLTVELVCAAPVRVRPAGFDVDPATRKKRYYLYPNEKSPATDPFCGKCFEACRDYQYKGYIPKVNEWIDVTGELITDTGPAGDPPRPAHGSREIHPVTSITRVNK